MAKLSQLNEVLREGAASSTARKRFEVVRFTLMVKKDVLYDIGNKKMGSPKEVHEMLSPYFANLDREHFVVVALGTTNRLIGINTASVGTVNASLVHPREVFKFAHKVGACFVILAHNHPSGDTEPSKEDREITKQMVEAGKIMGIPVRDHIVFGDTSYTSFVERGYL